MTEGQIIPPDQVYVGKDTNLPASITLSQVQKIFAEITGKTDTLGKRYDLNIRVTAEDINQLNSVVKQAMEQYDVKSSTCTVSVYYVDDTHQKFSSFEKFALLNAASMSCVENVSIKYDFLLIQPTTKFVQTFELSVQLTSRIAAQKHMRESPNFPMPRLLQSLLVGTTAVVNVKHVDFAIARTLLDTCDRWLTSCPSKKHSSLLKFAKSYSELVPEIFRYTIGGIAIWQVVSQLPNYLNVESTAALNIVTYSILSFAIIFTFYRAAWHFGGIVERVIDAYLPTSYVSLTRGDRSEIERAESDDRKNLVHVILAVCGTLVQAVIVKFVIECIFALMHHSG